MHTYIHTYTLISWGIIKSDILNRLLVGKFDQGFPSIITIILLLSKVCFFSQNIHSFFISFIFAFFQYTHLYQWRHANLAKLRAKVCRLAVASLSTPGPQIPFPATIALASRCQGDARKIFWRALGRVPGALRWCCFSNLDGGTTKWRSRKRPVIIWWNFACGPKMGF